MGVKVVEFRPGKWGLRINHKGNRKSVTIGSKRAAERAKLKAELALAQDKLGVVKHVDAPTFGKTAGEYLRLISLSRKPRTAQRYEGLINQYLSPALGSLPIDKITRGEVRNALLDIYQEGASRSSIELMHTVCSGVFNHAIDDEIIASNPARGLLKKLDLKRPPEKINPFTARQVAEFLDSVDKNYHNFFFLLYQTGMRVGEATALTWGDVNFSESTIKVNKTAKDQTISHSTKTYIIRDVDMSDQLSAMLLRMKAEDKKECFSLGIQQNRVFHKKGKLYSQQTLLRRLQKTCDNLGFGHKTIHDIRHTTASLLLARGVPVTYVSKLLGHSSPRITLDVYAQYMPSENKGAINLLTSAKKAVINTDAE